MANSMVITVFISFDFVYIPVFIYFSCQCGWTQNQMLHSNAWDPLITHVIRFWIRSYSFCYNSIYPKFLGTVLIMLAGAARGKRVVFLKQLASGLLLVTGPFKVNGVPMRRCTASAVIATSATVDISGFNVPDHVDDSYFKRAAAPKKTEEGIFESKVEAYTVSFSNSREISEEYLWFFRHLMFARLIKKLLTLVLLQHFLLTNSSKDTWNRNSVCHVVNIHTTWNSNFE